MTLLEMSVEYRSNCAVLKSRMRSLEEALAGTADPAQRQRLQVRIADLMALYRESREIALHLERYYDRRYQKNAKFTF